MPTVRWEPRISAPRYFYHSLERFKIFNSIKDIEHCISLMIFDACSGGSFDELLVCMLALVVDHLHSDLHRIRPSNMYPPDDFYPTCSFDPFWIEHNALFKHKFRFRLEHYHRMLRAIDFEDKIFRVGSSGKEHKYKADLCLLVVLRRLAYPIRFYDMVTDFGIPSNRLCEIFHFTLDILFEKFHAIVEFSTWLPYFRTFAEIMVSYGCPYDDLVALTDGNFLPTCRPGGLGNKRSRIDQSQFYTGEKARHGIKHLGSFFPNGMMALCGPFLGSVHDGRMIKESGWTDLLQLISRHDGRRYKVFGDSAFGSSSYVQSMIRGELSPAARAFNALMSRIRINIENAFGEQSNIFTFLAFHRGVKVGGRNTLKIYKVAAILMNMRCTFYGNQFTDQLGHPTNMSIEELIELCHH